MSGVVAAGDRQIGYNKVVMIKLFGAPNTLFKVYHWIDA